MASKVSGRIIVVAVLVLLVVVGGIFLLVGLLVGDDTKNQEHALAPAPAAHAAVLTVSVAPGSRPERR